MPVRWLCVNCHEEIEEVLPTEWIHKDSGKFVCKGKAQPKDQTVATKRTV